MLETLADFYKSISIVDLIYLIITIWSLISCYKKGFILSVLSMAKWLLAYVITLILFPRVKPYVKDIIDNEYVLDVGLGITIFVVVIFLVLLIKLSFVFGIIKSSLPKEIPALKACLKPKSFNLSQNITVVF